MRINKSTLLQRDTRTTLSVNVTYYHNYKNYQKRYTNSLRLYIITIANATTTTSTTDNVRTKRLQAKVVSCTLVGTISFLSR